MEYFIEIIMAALGALGYAVLFNVHPNKFFPATVGGALTWIVYLGISAVSDNIFLCNMVASIFATTYSETLARKMKAPATCFLMPSVIPLIPGSGLYYTMTAIISSNSVLFKHYFTSTVQTAFGISIGIMIVSYIGIRLLKMSPVKK